MDDEKLLSKLSINGSQYVIKDSTARENIASISGLAFNGAESLSGQIADLKAHGADSALSGVNHIQTQLNSLSGLALDGATSLSGAIAALETKEAEDVVSLSGSIETLKTKEQNDVNSLSGSIKTLSGLLVSAISGLDAEVTSTGGKRVEVQVKEVDGKITAVTVTENDIAKASDLTAETSNRESEDAKLATAISGVQTNLTNAISGLYFDDTLAANQFVTQVKQVDGKITVERAGVSADQVGITEISGVSGTNGKATNVQSALEIIENQVSAFAQGAKITVSGVSSSEQGILKTYTIYQGSKVAGSIDIPKDLVVTGGSVFAATGGTKVTGATVVSGALVLRLDIANQTNPVLIPVSSLTDVYTAGTTTEITTTLSGGQFSSTIVANSIAKGKLDSAVQTSLGKADTSIQHVNGKPGEGDNAGGDVVLYGTDILRVQNGSKNIDVTFTDVENSISGVSQRVSGLEQWKAGITVTYHNETLNINGLVGSVGEPTGSGD